MTDKPKLSIRTLVTDMSDAFLSEIDSDAAAWTDDWAEWQPMEPTKQEANAMFIRRVFELIEQRKESTPSPISQAAGEPIPMLLFCPKCHSQHIDSPKWERDPHDVEQGLICTWSNPPHKSHLCHACGNIWRPADVETTGVAFICTRGKADTWDSTAPTTGSAPVATLHDDGYYTFHGEKPHGFNYQGWRMDVYAAPASPAATSDFDSWMENPYTKVLQQSIKDDYVPKGSFVCIALTDKQRVAIQWAIDTSEQVSMGTYDGTHLTWEYEKELRALLVASMGGDKHD